MQPARAQDPDEGDREFIEAAVLASAARCTRAHDWEGAVDLLERYVRAARSAGHRDTSAGLRRIVVRLADLYRGLERVADELALIEGYLEDHGGDVQRSRFVARISKLHALLATARSSSAIPLALGQLGRPKLTRLERRARHEQRKARRTSAASVVDR